jgi:hypothetical protein
MVSSKDRNTSVGVRLIGLLHLCYDPGESRTMRNQSHETLTLSGHQMSLQGVQLENSPLQPW